MQSLPRRRTCGFPLRKINCTLQNALAEKAARWAALCYATWGTPRIPTSLLLYRIRSSAKSIAVRKLQSPKNLLKNFAVPFQKGTSFVMQCNTTMQYAVCRCVVQRSTMQCNAINGLCTLIHACTLIPMVALLFENIVRFLLLTVVPKVSQVLWFRNF